MGALGGQPNHNRLDSVTGRTANPITFGQALFVSIESLGGQQKEVLGYPYFTGTMAVGKLCLVTLDEGRNAWIVSWGV